MSDEDMKVPISPPVVLGGEGFAAAAKMEHELTLEKAKRREPGPPPWCPKCGAPAAALAVPRGPGFPNKEAMGVCQGCASILKPEFTRDKEVCPFFFHVSDLRAGTPEPVLHVQRQVRAALRKIVS